MKRFIAALFLFPAVAFASNTVTAVTSVLGSMTTVTIHTASLNYRYSDCLNLTPYIYSWNISDVVNISTNADSSVWTLNDLNTAAIAVCIIRTML